MEIEQLTPHITENDENQSQKGKEKQKIRSAS